MSGNLSQEEIDALLKGQNSVEEPVEKPLAAVQPLRSKKEKADPVKESAPAVSTKTPNIHPVTFPELTDDSPLEVPVAGMEVLLDVPLAISVELGRARCFVKDLLNLSSGSVVELDKAAGDAVDILVNGKLFARGEVVVIDENFGVRIQEIVHRR
ncbi:MAG: flagellar motor switch protein FliN [Bacillota bacterium]